MGSAACSNGFTRRARTVDFTLGQLTRASGLRFPRHNAGMPCSSRKEDGSSLATRGSSQTCCKVHHPRFLYAPGNLSTNLGDTIMDQTGTRRPALRRQGLRGLLFAAVWAAAAAGLRADDWPQWLGPQRDGVWRESGILDKFPKDGPKVRWRTPIGLGYAGPAVAGGRVYVTDRVLAEGAKNPVSGFGNQDIPGKERVICLDEATGTIVWKHEYDCAYKIGFPSGPRTTPAVADGKVYSIGTMGDLLCLDASDGKVIWSKNFPRDYKGNLGIWGAAAHPLVDGNKLICLPGGPGAIVAAFNKDTGKEIWHALEADQPGYAPPMIYQVGATRQLVVWNPDSVNGLDPETGKVFWSVPFILNRNSQMAISTPRLAGDQLFVTSFYDGSLMLKLAAD